MSDDDIENEFDTDDFDTGDFDDDGFDDLNDQQGTLGDLWRNNSLVKIGVILTAFAFLIGGVLLFGEKEERTPGSRVGPSQTITEAPGGPNEASASYREAVEQENMRRTEEAERNQNSVMPTPIGVIKSPLNLQLDEPEEEDPLERWRRMQEERIAQQQIEVQQNSGQPPPVEVDTRTPAINALALAMSQQMEGVLGNQQIKGANILPVATMGYLEALAEKERQEREAALAEQNKLLGNVVGDDFNILLPAGTIEYAQLITEANTDIPGPILAQIVTGPLKGGRLIGTFSSTDNYLTLNFNAIVLDGIDFAVNGVAIDPETTLPGVVTDIDRRYLKRVILPMAAEFITGFTSAIADSGKTTIVVNGSDGSSTTTTSGVNNSSQEVASGVAEAGEALAEILDEVVGNTKPLLRVRAGTPIGVLFVSPVIDTPRVTQQRQQGS